MDLIGYHSLKRLHHGGYLLCYEIAVSSSILLVVHWTSSNPCVMTYD